MLLIVLVKKIIYLQVLNILCLYYFYNIQIYFNFIKDVTPNGSLRRRRSRVPSEEDEVTLMDFLRTSNQDAPPVSNIQRKSWGSLGNE